MTTSESEIKIDTKHAEDAKKILMKLDPKVLEQIMSMQQQHDR